MASSRVQVGRGNRRPPNNRTWRAKFCGQLEPPFLFIPLQMYIDARHHSHGPNFSAAIHRKSIKVLASHTNRRHRQQVIQSSSLNGFISFYRLPFRVFFFLCVVVVSLLLFWPCCCCLSSSIQHLRHAFHTPHATRDQLVNYIFYLMEAHVQRINCLSMLSRILIDRRAALRNIFATTMAIVNNSTEADMVDEFGSKWSTGGVNKDIDSLWPPCDTCSLR